MNTKNKALTLRLVGLYRKASINDQDSLYAFIESIYSDEVFSKSGNIDLLVQAMVRYYEVFTKYKTINFLYYFATGYSTDFKEAFDSYTIECPEVDMSHLEYNRDIVDFIGIAERDATDLSLARGVEESLAMFLRNSNLAVNVILDQIEDFILTSICNSEEDAYNGLNFRQFLKRIMELGGNLWQN